MMVVSQGVCRAAVDNINVSAHFILEVANTPAPSLAIARTS